MGRPLTYPDDPAGSHADLALGCVYARARLLSRWEEEIAETGAEGVAAAYAQPPCNMRSVRSGWPASPRWWASRRCASTDVPAVRELGAFCRVSGVASDRR